MNSNVTTERNRALANPAAESKNQFGMPMRTGELNNFMDGDVITIPACELKDVNGEKVLVAAGTEDKVVISEPMMQNGQAVVRNGQPVMLTYMIVDVKRGTENTTARLFPSLFWKSRQGYTKEGTGKYTKGARQVAYGDVVDEARKYPSVDEAIVAICGKSFSYKKHECPAPKFGVSAADTLDAADINESEFIPEIQFVLF